MVTMTEGSVAPVTWVHVCVGEVLRPRVFFSRRSRHTRCSRDWSSDVCSSDLEEEIRTGRMAQPCQPARQRCCQPMNALGYLLKPFRAMIAGVHRGDVRQQRLGGADVTGGFFTADMLFARLQRQPQGRATARVFGNADDAARCLAFESVASGEIRRVRPAVAERHAKALR